MTFYIKKISLQEEINEIKRWEKDKGWQATNQILLLLAELLKVEDFEVSTDDILDQPHDTDEDLLLETVFCSMRESTLSYRKKIKSERKCKVQIIQTQINKLTSSINAVESFEETKKLEGELLEINEDFLADQAAIF